MADNIAVTPGSGATVAAENIGGILVQRIKPVIGPLDIDGGDVSAGNPMPINGNVTISQTATLTVQVPTSVTVSQSTASLFNANVSGNVTVSQSSASLLNTNVSGSVTVSQSSAANLNATITDSLLTVAEKTIKVAYTASQTAAVVVITTGKTAYITDIVVSASVAGSIYLYDTTDNSTHGIGPVLNLAANGGWTHSFKKPYIAQSTGSTISATSGTGATGSIWMKYYEV